MKKLKENILSLLLMLSIPISNIFYKFLNNSVRGSYNLALDIDKNIPFVKEFIIPYIVWYPYIFMFLVYICIKNKDVYYRTLLSLNLGLVVCYIIFFFFQTGVSRPILTETDRVTNLVRMIYNHDKPYNCFPSVHVITTYIVMKGINVVSKNKFILFFCNIIGILIIISTQFVKQHVILDLIVAIALGKIIFGVAIEKYSKKESLFIKKILSLIPIKDKLQN